MTPEINVATSATYQNTKVNFNCNKTPSTHTICKNAVNLPERLASISNFPVVNWMIMEPNNNMTSRLMMATTNHNGKWMSAKYPLLIYRQIKALIKSILSARGSRMAPALVFWPRVRAMYPSMMSETTATTKSPKDSQ